MTRRALVLVALATCAFATSNEVASAGPGLTKERICELWPNLPEGFRKPENCPVSRSVFGATLAPVGFAPLAAQAGTARRRSMCVGLANRSSTGQWASTASASSR
jgi:hypothetical protein